MNNQSHARVRLSKRMAEMGMCSRREADEYISRGLVFVNGSPAALGQKVTPDDLVEMARAAAERQERLVTILLHKPLGYVSGQAESGYRPARVLVRPENRWHGDTSPLRFDPSQLRGLVPAGRLDINSTGLLVLTQDGRIARHIIGEDSGVEKEYIVRIAGVLSEDGLRLLNHGLALDGETLLPARVRFLGDGLLRFILRQGKKRQIRRMCELVGVSVTALRRVRVGGVRLGALPAGRWRYLGADESF